MNRVKSAPNLTGKAIKRSSSQNNLIKKPHAMSCSKLSALQYSDPLPIEIVQSISTEHGIASGVCFELYGKPADDSTFDHSSEQDLAECLATPISNDKGLGEIVQAEVDDITRKMEANEVNRRKRLIMNWAHKNLPG